MRLALLLALAPGLAASPALAVSPVMACDDVIESGMVVHDMLALDTLTLGTGVVIERYEVAPGRSAPVAELAGFRGARAVSCATGEFLAISGRGASEVKDALARSEPLRDLVEAGQPVAFAHLRRTADALYGPLLVLRETDQTCACEAYFDHLRPSGQTPFEERPDASH